MLSFAPDAGLMYLIQQVTKQSTDEILGFFYDFGKQVFITGVANMKEHQRDIRKDIRALYPNTAIPFKMLVEGGKDRYNYHTKKSCMSGRIYVQFPDNPSYIDTTKLIDMIMEKQLLGGSSLPPFEEPKSRTPKMYKDLIEQVLKGKSDETLNIDSSSDPIDEL